MSAEPLPAILPPLKLLRATLLKSDLRIIIGLKMVVQVALPLLVPLSEESVDVRQRLFVEILQVIVRLQSIN